MIRWTSLIAATLLIATAAWAEDPMEISVVGYGRLPAGAQFSTEPADNSEITDHVDQSLRQAMTGKGFQFSEDADLVFAINADTTGRTGSNLGVGPQNNAQVHITINTSQNEFIGGATQPANTIPHTFRITLALYQRSTGHYLWRGEITDLKPDADPLAATGPMVAKLVEALGKSVGPAQ